MSIVAIDYVCHLTRCPDGFPLPDKIKLVLMVLANYHSERSGRCFPGLPTIAKEAGSIGYSTAKRRLRYLEQHGAIRVGYPENQGREQTCEYRFPVLEGDGESVPEVVVPPKPPASKVLSAPERWREARVQAASNGEQMRLAAAAGYVPQGDATPAEWAQWAERRREDGTLPTWATAAFLAEKCGRLEGAEMTLTEFFSPPGRGSEGVQKGFKTEQEGVQNDAERGSKWGPQ